MSECRVHFCGGQSFFRSLRESSGYYVDKTALVDHVLRDPNKVQLILRPRGFGTSLNLNMMDEYLSLKSAGKPDVFEGLEIETLRPEDPEKSSNVVIPVSLYIKDRDYDGFIWDMRWEASETYRLFPELGSSSRLDDRDRGFYDLIASGDPEESDLEDSLFRLTRMLEVEYGKKAIVLIDSYDTPLRKTASPSIRDRIGAFLSGFLTVALADNPHLRLAVITGMTYNHGILRRIPSSSDDVFHSRLGRFWGFTREEIWRIFSDFGGGARFGEAVEWYGGFRFGGTEVCNPVSVIDYIGYGFKTGDEYWIGSSTDRILRTLFGTLGMDDFRQVLKLMCGGSFETELYHSPAFGEPYRDRTDMFSMMAMTGYLRVVPSDRGRYMVSFPNREIGHTMRRFMWCMTPLSTYVLDRYRDALREGDTDRMERILGQMLAQEGCITATGGGSYEQVLMTVLTAMTGSHIIRSEQDDAGLSIVMESRVSGLANAIWRIVEVDWTDNIGPAAEEAVERIHDRRYRFGLEGTVLLYGIGFCGTVSCICHHRVELPADRGKIMLKAVLYDSNTGNTEAMAIAIAEGARASGAEVYLGRADDADIGRMLSCDVIYLGCPAMGVEQYGDAQQDLLKETGDGFRGKRVAVFGSCRSGSGMWLRRWASELQFHGADVFDYPGLIAVLRPSADVLERCRELGRAFSDERCLGIPKP